MTNQQRVQRGLGPLEAPAEGDDSPCVDENFEQDFYENYDNLSENENFSGEDKSNKKQVYSRKKTNDRVYSCKHCGKVSSSKGNLKKHEVLHLSVKPWQCKICNCNFNQARDLKAHQMQKHSGERPHICKVNRSSFLILVCIMFQKVGLQSCDIFLTLCFIYNNQIILGATLAFQSLLANRNFLFAFKCRKRIK